jgi:hypothetical protein
LLYLNVLIFEINLIINLKMLKTEEINNINNSPIKDEEKGINNAINS